MSLHPQQSTIVQSYEQKLTGIKEQLTRLNSSYFFVGLFRLVCIIALFVSLYFLVTTDKVIIGAFTLLSIIGFLYGVKRQVGLDTAISHLKNLSAVYENEVSCILQKVSSYYNGEKYLNTKSAYNVDLDIYGSHSLFEIINRAKTNVGITYLTQYLEILPSREELDKRRAAIQELEDLPDWLADYKAHLWQFEAGHRGDLTTEIRESLTLDLSFAQTKLLSLYIVTLPYVWLLIALAYIAGLPQVGSIATGLFLFNLVLAGRHFKAVGKVQQALSRLSSDLSKIGRAARHILEHKWKSDLLLSSCQHHTDHSSSSQPLSINRLSAIISKLDFRLNILAGTVLNGLLLWDLRMIKQLISWKHSDEAKVYQLIELVGLVEGLVSLATWGHNHPHYSYSITTDEHFTLQAKGIYHPLIDYGDNIANDFSIEDGQYISMLTGSNMSGKSTFLRTIGINLVLSYAGARTASDHLAAPLVKVITYMRIKDVLEENVSTFKAELNRIEMILHYLQDGEPCFYLIDEMLRGTNSYDKLNGSIAITRKLLQHKGYSMIATHDIKLAELVDKEEAGIKNYYFDIEFHGQDLAFDYKIKEGICSSFNASFLLHQLGLDIDVDHSTK